MPIHTADAPIAIPQPADAPGCTLLELVGALTDLGADEDAVVDAARTLVNEGQVRLTGNFRGCRLQ